MPLFIIDVNLPAHIEIWRGNDFISQLEIDRLAPDNEIWDFAKKENLTIISKDTDFSDKILLNSPPPKVIHIKLGNMRLKEFRKIIADNWQLILEVNKTHKLVNVFKDRIEGID